jgi:CBS domain-containing protein
MRVEEIMKGPVSTVKRDSTVQQAARTMDEEDIGFLPVVDDSGRVVGVVTDRDITVRVVAQGLAGNSVRVEQVMTTNAFTAKKGDDVRKVAEQMKERQVSRMLVVDDGGKPIGVVSLGDLAERADEREAGSTLKEVKEGVTLTH